MPKRKILRIPTEKTPPNHDTFFFTGEGSRPELPDPSTRDPKHPHGPQLDRIPARFWNDQLSSADMCTQITPKKHFSFLCVCAVFYIEVNKKQIERPFNFDFRN